MKIITSKTGLWVSTFFILFITACGNKQGDTTPVSSRTTLEVVKNEITDINNPGKAYQAMVEGNQRYMNGQFIHVHIKRLNEEDEEGEKPFVAILTCPDLKIPPEILFDVDRNNIQLIRSNASLENDSVIASLKDGVLKHNIHLVMVLGHHDCPALKRLLADRVSEKPADNKKIDSAIDYDPILNEPVYSKTAVNNVKQVASRILKSSAFIDSAIKKSGLEVKPVFYNETHRKLIFTEGL
jgi:carbonic anhydrase